MSMKHFKIHAPFEKFFFHLKSNIDRKDKQKVCVLHTSSEGAQDIYFSTEDELIIGMMQEQFELESCNSPATMLKENMDKWMVRGNGEILRNEF